MAMAAGALLPCRAASDALRITPVDGNPVVISFDYSPEVTFTGTGLKVTANSIDPVAFDFDQIESMDFTDASSVKAVGTTDIMLCVTSHSVEISNAGEESHVSFYGIDGREIFSTNFENAISVERSRLPKGVSIIRINNTSFKITL